MANTTANVILYSIVDTVDCELAFSTVNRDEFATSGA